FEQARARADSGERPSKLGHRTLRGGGGHARMAAAIRNLDDTVRSLSQTFGLLVVDMVYETRHRAQACRFRGGESLAAGDQAVSVACMLDDERLQHAVMPDRFDERRLRQRAA